ncbi:hypothetical protein E2320_022075 [Naja naja]|nr:hypothetical protein E2320_022075 [Naja naja]
MKKTKKKKRKSKNPTEDALACSHTSSDCRRKEDCQNTPFHFLRGGRGLCDEEEKREALHGFVPMPILFFSTRDTFTSTSVVKNYLVILVYYKQRT